MSGAPRASGQCRERGFDVTMKVCSSCKSLCPDEAVVCPACGAPLEVAEIRDADRLVGLTLGGKYELTDYLGEGAMGWVYRGRHLALDSSVAVKILKPELRPNAARAERFKLEARAASRLNHPHIISVIDFGETPSGLLYIVTEFLRGQPLANVIAKEAPLSLKRTFRLMSQILSALEESHNAGVIHRDLKPDNIMVSKLRGGEEFVKVLDFGIAKLADQPPGASLTQAGQLFGTPDYMAPEQIRSLEVTGAADLYAAGVILFEMLTGSLPFVQDNLFDILKDHLYTPPPRLSDVYPKANFDEALEEVVARALAKDPADRFRDAREFRRALRRAIKAATSRLARCPACGAYVKAGAHFCPDCGYPLDEKAKMRASNAAMETIPPVQTGRGQTLMGSQATLHRLWSREAVGLPLVGRKAELEQLERFLAGDVHTLVLSGETGAGKTALAQRALQKAAEANKPAITVTAHPSLLPVPWYPIRTAVCQALGLPDDPQPEALEAALERRPGLEDLLPGLLALIGLPGPLDEAETETKGVEIRSAARYVLSHAFSGIVFFDDLDLYDRPSAEVVGSILSEPDRSSQVLVASGLPLGTLGEGVVTCHLGPLSQEDVSTIVAHLAKNEKSSWADVLAKVAGKARVTPLWLEQAVALMAEAGTEASLGLTDLMTTRVSRLPGPALEIVQALAVLGIEAPASAVAYLLDRRELSVPTMDLLVHRGLLSEEATAQSAPPGARMLRFRHPLFVEVIRESLPRDRRRELNSRAADLAAEAGSDPMIRAHHLLEAERHDDAVSVLETAGNQALCVTDPEGATALFRQAVETARWSLLVPEEDDLNIRLNRRLAEALASRGDYDGAVVVLKYLDGLVTTKPKRRARIRYLLARTEMRAGRPAKALEFVRKQVGEAILLGDPELIAEGYLLLAEILESLGRKSAAQAELDEAAAFLVSDGAPPASLPRSIWRLLVRLALLSMDNDPKGAQRAANLARLVAERIGDKLGAARAMVAEAACRHKLGHNEEAVALLEEARRTYALLGDRKAQAYVLLQKARFAGNGDRNACIKEAARLLKRLGLDADPLVHDLVRTPTQELVAATQPRP